MGSQMFKKSQTLFLLPVFFLVLFFAQAGFGEDMYCRDQGRPASQRGCYKTIPLAGGKKRCEWGFQYCLTKPRCEDNVAQGHWYGNSCNPTPQQATRGEKCDESKGIVANDTGECVCNDTGNKPINGECKSAGQGKCLASEGQATNDNEGCYCTDPKKELVNGKCEAKSGDSKDVNFASKCSQAGAIYASDEEETCYCNGKLFTVQDIQAGAKCNADKPIVASEETDDDAKFARVAEQCGLTDAENKIAKCGEDAFAAVEECDEKAAKENSSNTQIKGALDLMSSVQQKNAITSADPDVCGKAAYGATAAYWAIDAFKTNCEAKVKICKDACNPLKEKETFKQMVAKCERLYNQEFKVTGAATDRVPTLTLTRLDNKGLKVENQSKDYRRVQGIKEYINEMEKDSQKNFAKCDSDAAGGALGLGDYLSQLLQASVGAATCKNAASTSAARCAALASQLTPAYCLTKATEPCCCSFNGTCPGSPIVDCNGKDYAAKTCVCARTPDAGVCKTTVAGGGTELTNPGGVSGIATPGGITSGTAYKPTGVVPQGGVDVGADDASKMQQSAGGTGGSTNPFGAAGSSGGGGGGGMPSSPNDGLPAGAAAAGDGGGSSSSGGPFNQLKTWADKIMGGGNGSNNNKNYGNDPRGKDKDKKAGAGVDPNKWRPGLRGVAGGSEFGPRNKDIWKTMNGQYGIQNHTFLGLDGN